MSSFVKHPDCKEQCQDIFNGKGLCVAGCFLLGLNTVISTLATDSRPIFEERDTDQESRLDRRARARECK